MRNLATANAPNTGRRSLRGSVLYPQVLRALNSWVTNAPEVGTMIGGIALSHYVKPRTTQDVDMLFLGKSGVPDHVVGFRRSRPGAFEHINTGVEIEVLLPAAIHMSAELAAWIVAGAAVDRSLGYPVRIASPSGIVASKLERFSRQDQADIEALCTSHHVDVSDAPLSSVQHDRLRVITDTITQPGEAS